MKHADDRMISNAAYMFIVIFALTEAALIFARIEPGNIDMLKEMVSTLRDAILFLVGFLFGSSLGSRAKDKPVLDAEGGAVVTQEPKTP